MSEIQSSQLLDERKLHVSLNYGNLNAEFSGNAPDVSRLVNDFLAKNVPAISLASSISVNFSIQDLISKFHDYVKLTPEGPRIWPQDQPLSDKEIVALQLVAERIAYESAGDSSRSTTLTRLQEATALNPKSLSSRLSELIKAGYATRESTGIDSGFRISTQGVDWLSRTLSKKSSSK